MSGIAVAVEAWSGWAVALRWLAEAAAVVRAETKQGAHMLLLQGTAHITGAVS